MVHMDNNNNNFNTMDSSSNPSNTDHDNSIVDSSLQSNTEALLIFPSPSLSLHTDYSDEEDQQKGPSVMVMIQDGQFLNAPEKPLGIRKDPMRA